MSDFHHAAIDDHPDDSSCRLLLGEYLAERGDPDAAGYRWMAERRKRPTSCEPSHPRTVVWEWWRSSDFWSKVSSDLPDKLFDQVSKRRIACWVSFPTRRAAELALCRAVSEMQKEAET